MTDYSLPMMEKQSTVLNIRCARTLQTQMGIIGRSPEISWSFISTTERGTLVRSFRLRTYLVFILGIQTRGKTALLVRQTT